MSRFLTTRAAISWTLPVRFRNRPSHAATPIPTSPYGTNRLVPSIDPARRRGPLVSTVRFYRSDR